MKKFNFKNYIVKKGFTDEGKHSDNIFENDNGWVIYVTKSPDNQEMLIIYWRGDESAFIENLPKSEDETINLFENNGIE